MECKNPTQVDVKPDHVIIIYSVSIFSKSQAMDSFFTFYFLFFY